MSYQTMTRMMILIDHFLANAHIFIELSELRIKYLEKYRFSRFLGFPVFIGNALSLSWT